MLWLWAAGPPAGAAEKLAVVYLNCGQGDAAYLRLPNGKTALVDAGPREDWNEFDAGRDVIFPFLKERKIRRIDYAVLSHAHLDHLGGFLFLLDKIQIGAFYDPGIPYPSPEYAELLGKLAEKNVAYSVLAAGDVLDWDPALQVRVLSPPGPAARNSSPKKASRKARGADLNDDSLVISVAYGKTKFLFTGDIEKKAEARLSAEDPEDLRCDVLKVPHHGSRTSSTDKFLETAGPRMAVISCGRRNGFGHPHPETLDRYKARKIEVFRTSDWAAIEAVSNGRKVQMKPERR